MARILECVEASASLMAALNQGGDLEGVLGLIEEMDPGQVLLTMVLFRTEPKSAPKTIEYDQGSGLTRESLRAALREIHHEHVVAGMQIIDENLSEIGPRELIDHARGRLEGEQQDHIIKGIVSEPAMLSLVGRILRAMPEPPDVDNEEE